MKKLNHEKVENLSAFSKRIRKDLSAKQTSALLKNNGAVKRDDLQLAYVDDCDKYVLPDGKLLLVFKWGGSGTLYTSVDDFKNLMNLGLSRIKKIFPSDDQSAAVDPVSLIKLTAQKFEEITIHPNSLLAKELDIDPKLLDYSLGSLRVLDKELNQYSKETIFDSIFPLLVAYTGETIRQEVKGKWIIEADLQGSLRKVEIMSDGNDTYNPYSFLITTLLESDAKINTLVEVKVELSKYGLFKRQ